MKFLLGTLNHEKAGSLQHDLSARAVREVFVVFRKDLGVLILEEGTDKCMPALGSHFTR